MGGFQMKLQTFQWVKEKGWSVDNFPDLDSEDTLVIIFGAPNFINDQETIKQLRQHYSHSKIVGCSTAGEIYGSLISDNSLSVSVIKFEKTKLKIFSADIDDAKESKKVGKLLADKLNQSDLKAVFVLSEGININGSELVSGLNTLDTNKVTITGGLAGDGDQFKKTWCIIDGEIKSNKVVAVGFYGDSIHIGHGSKGGWDIFGIERRITRAQDNILYELDGKPALQLYKEYLGDKASALPASGLLFPLAIRKEEEGSPQIVRTILGVDEKESSLIFAGDMPIGYLAQLMRANFDRLITGAIEAGKLALKSDNFQNEEQPMLVISISCVGRRLLLGERTEEETESVLEIFPKNSQQIGFYSYGELSPYVKGSCNLHNQTMTLTTIREEV